MFSGNEHTFLSLIHTTALTLPLPINAHSGHIRQTSELYIIVLKMWLVIFVSALITFPGPVRGYPTGFTLACCSGSGVRHGREGMAV